LESLFLEQNPESRGLRESLKISFWNAAEKILATGEFLSITAPNAPAALSKDSRGNHSASCPTIYDLMGKVRF
jgi:hypothetical protein